uniref:Uncharacterized protein n=1 Tax=Salmo trutta TaxID=8032 RepID=A0A673WC56_SALTR
MSLTCQDLNRNKNIRNVHYYKEGKPEVKTYCIELWDVRGSVGCASSLNKSNQNLHYYHGETILTCLVLNMFPCLNTSNDYDREQFADSSVPFLLIVTKFDQIPENKRNDVLTRTAFLSEDFNAEEISLVDASSLQLVIEKRCFTRDPSKCFTERKRFNFKSPHYG